MAVSQLLAEELESPLPHQPLSPPSGPLSAPTHYSFPREVEGGSGLGSPQGQDYQDCTLGRGPVEVEVVVVRTRRELKVSSDVGQNVRTSIHNYTVYICTSVVKQNEFS